MKSTFRHFIILLATLLCAAAIAQPVNAPTAPPKPGDADFPSPAPSVRHDEKVAAVRSGRYDLVLIGDSITHALGELGGKYEPLTEVWNRHFAPRHAINLGHNGYRTEQILWNLQNGELDFAPSPKAAILLIGTNNSDDRHFSRVHTPEEIFAGTKAIVDLIRQRHPTTKILILRIFPRGGDAERGVSPPAFNSSAQCIETCRRAGELTAKLADGQHVFWLDLNYVFLRPDGTINTDMLWDLLHPSPAGAEAWAQSMEPTLAELMGDQPLAAGPAGNSALIPVTKLENDSYDWYARHADVLRVKESIDPDVVLIGDSITHFWGGEPKAAQANGPGSWHATFGKYRTLNLGFGWDRIQNVLWRLDHGELDGLHPRVVVLHIGTNNTSDTESARSNTPEEIAEGVGAILRRLRAKVPDARIILMAVFPREQNPDHPRRVRISEINQRLADFAHMPGITFLDIGPKLLQADGTIARDSMADFCHPTDKGYQIWGEALAPLLAWATQSDASERTGASPPQTFVLWPEQAPIGDGTFEKSEARITVYRPAHPNGAAAVICPGGGYGGLVTGPEGSGIAHWLNAHGIAGIVLEYRLPHGRAFVPLLDAQRAIRLARAHAQEWGYNPHRIGIIGFSAGGHLASTVATHFDSGKAADEDPIERASSRPDFAILVYPVITMGEKTHRGSSQNLLGAAPSPELIDLFSNEKQVTSETPPVFLAHALDDKVVPVEHSRMFYDALRSHHVTARYLELPSGDHGLNGYKGPMWDAWQSGALSWWASLNLIPIKEQTDVFVSGQDGYHTYRIPAIEAAPDGSLIAFAEARKYNAADPGFGKQDIDLVYKRSTNNGATWSPMKVLEDPGELWSAANPCTVLDRTNRWLWVFYLRSRPERSTDTARPGTDDLQTIARWSDDNGDSWSEPIDLTAVARDMNDPAWRASVPGPGGAIQTRTGRLLVPMWKAPFADFAIFSDDHGITWHRGDVVPGKQGGDEDQLVELADGRILMDFRQNQGTHRWLVESTDGGATWTEPRAGLDVTPVACAIERLSSSTTGGDRNRLLWTGPRGPDRRQLVLRCSYDEGRTFPSEQLLSDSYAAYSDLTILNDGSIGVLWERGAQEGYQFITFTRVNREFLEPAPAK